MDKCNISTFIRVRISNCNLDIERDRYSKLPVNCKYFQKKLSLVTMQRKIQSLYNIEKSIAIKNKKNDFFQPDMECFHFTV